MALNENNKSDEVYLFKYRSDNYLLVCLDYFNDKTFEQEEYFSINLSKRGNLEDDFSVDLESRPFCFDYQDKSYWLFLIRDEYENFSLERFTPLDKNFKNFICDYLDRLPEEQLQLYKFLTDTFKYEGKGFVYKNLLILDERKIDKRRELCGSECDYYFDDFYRGVWEDDLIPSVNYEGIKYYIFGAIDWEVDYSEIMPEEVLLPEDFRKLFENSELKKLEKKVKSNYEAYKKKTLLRLVTKKKLDLFLKKKQSKKGVLTFLICLI